MQDKGVVFKKVCRYCRKEYESSVRHQRYCSDECAKKAGKVKKSRRGAYGKAQDENKLIARAYKLSYAVALKCVPKPEGWVDDPKVWTVHHKDMVPLNCSPWNLMWIRCEEHAKLHSMLPSVNAVKELSNVLSPEGQSALKASNDHYMGRYGLLLVDGE